MKSINLIYIIKLILETLLNQFEKAINDSK